jgi:hypothetical protein
LGEDFIPFDYLHIPALFMTCTERAVRLAIALKVTNLLDRPP